MASTKRKAYVWNVYTNAGKMEITMITMQMQNYIELENSYASEETRKQFGDFLTWSPCGEFLVEWGNWPHVSFECPYDKAQREAAEAASLKKWAALNEFTVKTLENNKLSISEFEKAAVMAGF